MCPFSGPYGRNNFIVVTDRRTNLDDDQEEGELLDDNKVKHSKHGNELATVSQNE